LFLNRLCREIASARIKQKRKNKHKICAVPGLA
jgi:hypothetical protein